MRFERRQFLAGSLATLGGLGAGRTLASAPAAAPSSSLVFYHIHTGERLSLAYRDNGRLVDEALHAVNYFLRDFRTGDIKTIDVDLLDTLSYLYDRFGRVGRYEIISGYRTPRTNNALRHITTGVAEHSLHMDGRAIDVRLVGIETDHLRAAAIDMSRGGVGYYPDSNFVHLDTGAVRRW